MFGHVFFYLCHNSDPSYLSQFTKKIKLIPGPFCFYRVWAQKQGFWRRNHRAGFVFQSPAEPYQSLSRCQCVQHLPSSVVKLEFRDWKVFYRKISSDLIFALIRNLKRWNWEGLIPFIRFWSKVFDQLYHILASLRNSVIGPVDHLNRRPVKNAQKL